MKQFIFLFFLHILIFIQNITAQNINGLKIYASKDYTTTLHFHDKYTKLGFGETYYPYKIDAFLSDEKTVVLKALNEVKEPYTLSVIEGNRRHKFIILYKEHPEDWERDIDFSDLKQLDKLVKEQTIKSQQTASVTTNDSSLNNNAVFLITDADNLKRNGQLENAQKKYEQAILLQPNNGYAQTALDEIKKAIATRDEAVFSDIITKANNAFTANNFNEALKDYTEALQIKKGDIYINSQIEITQKKIDTARIKEQNRIVDSLFTSYINAGDKSLKDTLYSSAKFAYTEALKIKPGNSFVLRSIKNVDDKIFADSINAVSLTNQGLLVSYINTGDKALENKLYEQARFAYKQALKINPTDVNTNSKLNLVDAKIITDNKQADEFKKDSIYTIYIKSGDKALKDSSYAVAKAAYDSALNLKPNDTYTVGNLKKADNALIALQKQAQHNLEIQQNLEHQNEYTALISYGDKNYDSGNYDEAKTSYNKALQINKNDSYSKNKIIQINKIFNDAQLKHKQDSVNDNKYTSAITKADKALLNKDYTNAKQLYNYAFKYKDNNYPKLKLSEIEAILITIAATKQAVKDSLLKQKETNAKYADLITKAKTAYSKKDYTTAKIMYTAAIQLKPDDNETKLKLIKIDSEQVQNTILVAMQIKSDSLVNSGEIALASNEFLLALDDFNEAIPLSRPDDHYYLKKQIAYIQYELKIAEQQRKEDELNRNFDSAMSAYRAGKEDLKYMKYEDELFNFKKFLSITDTMDEVTLNKSDYNLDRILKYVKEKVSAIETYLANPKTVSVRKDSLTTVSKLYGSYAPMLYYPNPKDPSLNYVYEKYFELNLNASPPDQQFDSLLSFNIENNLIGRQIMSLKPALKITDSAQNIKMICQNIKFIGANAYFKFLIMNYDTTEFLTGKMILTNHETNGTITNLYPNYIANYPIILPSRQKVVVYVIKIANIDNEDHLNFKLIDRLKKYNLSINIPGTYYNHEKQY